MKSGSKLFGFALALAAFIGVSSVEAAVQMNKAVVRAVRGTANYSIDKGANWKKLNVGATIGQNSIIRTAEGSTVDLFLGDNGPVVRVTQDTTMGIDKLTSENTGVEKVIETQLDLRNGRILGNVKKLAAASKYEITTPFGVAGIRGTKYDISANGRVSVIEGSVLVVYVVAGVPQAPVLVTAGQTLNPPTAAGAPNAPVLTPPGTVMEPPPIGPAVEVITAAIVAPRETGQNNFEAAAVDPNERAERIRNVIEEAIAQGITSPGEAIQLLQQAGINDSAAKQVVNDVVRQLRDTGRPIPRPDRDAS